MEGTSGTLTQMTEAAAPRRRWFQFSLGAMLALLTGFATWLGYEANWMHSRRTFLAEEAALRQGQPFTLGAEGTDYNTIGFVPDAPGVLKYLGERGYSGVTVLTKSESPDKMSDKEHARMRRAMALFPEATIMSGHVTNGGRSFVGEGYMPQYPRFQ